MLGVGSTLRAPCLAQPEARRKTPLVRLPLGFNPKLAATQTRSRLRLSPQGYLTSLSSTANCVAEG